MDSPVKECRHCGEAIVKEVTEAWVDVEGTTAESIAYMPGRTFLVCEDGHVTQELGESASIGERDHEPPAAEPRTIRVPVEFAITYDLPIAIGSAYEPEEKARSLARDLEKPSLADLDNSHPDFEFKRHIRLRNDYDQRLWELWRKEGTRWQMKECGVASEKQQWLWIEEKQLRNTRRWIWER